MKKQAKRFEQLIQIESLNHQLHIALEAVYRQTITLGLSPDLNCRAMMQGALLAIKKYEQEHRGRV